MKTCVHLYLAELFLEREMFQTEVLQKNKTHFIFNNLFSGNLAFYEIMWKYMI
jgi:hypothetical protein